MSRFPGKDNHMPGHYRMAVRVVGLNSAAWGENDIRSDLGWLAAAGDLLTSEQITAMQARAEIKQINVFVESGTVEFADAEAPGGEYRGIDSGPTTLNINYSNRMGRYQYWTRTIGGAATFQVEIFFDIPPEEYTT